MPKALLIAEKPSLRRSIEDVYKKVKSKLPYEIEFTEQHGHLTRLLLPSELDPSKKKWSWENLPVHPEDLGGWKYVPIDEKKTGKFMTPKERLDSIKKELKSGQYSFVIHAGDPDQEGELLVHETLEFVGNKLPVKRFWTNDLTEKAIENALMNLMDDDKDPMLINLYDASVARQHSDYRVGMNLSQACSLKMGGRAAVGRVKTPILAIVCRREDEIKNFKPVTVYGVKSSYAEGFDGTLYSAADDTEEAEDEKDQENTKGIVWFPTRKEAEDVIASLGSSAVITDIVSKHEKTMAPKLYKLATIQTDAGKFGFKADRVLNTIQSLYEAGYMSYPRTDCEYLSSSEDFKSFLDTVRNVAGQCKSASFSGLIESIAAPFKSAEVWQMLNNVGTAEIDKVKKSSKWINDKALQESGHSALRVTDNAPDITKLSNDEQIIYLMIMKRFAAMFLPPFECDKTTVLTKNNDHTFRSTGKKVTAPGYTALLGISSNDTLLPALTKNQTVTVKENTVTEKTSTCPKRYSDGELIAACENPLKYLDDESLKRLGKELKIGTPATRASIISQLIVKDKYMSYVKDGKIDRIAPTDDGAALIKNLGDREICKVDMTGIWEEKLQAVRAGTLSLAALEQEMIANVNAQVEDIKTCTMGGSLGGGSNAMGQPICTCPTCGRNIITGRKSFFCEGYKDGNCNTGVQFSFVGTTISKEDAVRLFKGEIIIKKLFHNGKSWEQKLVFDKDTQKVEFVKEEASESSLVCPVCNKPLMESESVFNCECGFRQYKEVAHKKISNEEWNTIFTKGKSGLIKGFRSKAGKPFNAYLKLEDGKVTFEFAK